MRHPTTGVSEDDLSRLTGSSSSSSSSTSSCNNRSSSSSSSSPTDSSPSDNEQDFKATDKNDYQLQIQKQSPEKSHTHKSTLTTTNIINNNNNNNNQFNAKLSTNTTAAAADIADIATAATTAATATRFNSTYLPEFINPLEWQKSRKRKERLDSSSSIQQDRKLQRSNSEENFGKALLDTVVNATCVSNDTTTATTNEQYNGNALKAIKNNDVIRRVSSEDFKKTSYEAYEQELLNDSNDCIGKEKEKQATDENDASLANRRDSLTQNNAQNDYVRRARSETSPARSTHHTSPIRGGNGNKHRDSDDSECEHERRRSSERSCKSRAPPGRRSAGITKKCGRYTPSKRTDENAYKYDLSTLKYERRGFVSKKIISTDKPIIANCSDHNDNNIVDVQQTQQKKISPASPTSSIGSDKSAITMIPTAATATATATATITTTTNNDTTTLKSSSSNSNSNASLTSAQEALPWDRSVPEDQTPILSRRYAAVRHRPDDNIDTAAKLSKIMPYPQQLRKQTTTAALLLAADDSDDCMEPINAFRSFTSLNERDVLQQVIPAIKSHQSPDEKLKHINKRMNALKKKLTQMEEAFEKRLGYRPSQAERLNDKHMKNILADISKLRKERQELKTEPIGALGVKVKGSMMATDRLEGMKQTLQEIEKSLCEKRQTAKRPGTIETLTAQQLLEEKTAVQHGLLYFESYYGRPTTKDERDVVRSLYDRYRQIKRMVSRSVSLSSNVISGAPELPTILEHEAMVFESTPLQYSSNNSTETTNSPSDVVAPTTITSDDSPTTTTTTTTTTATSKDTTISALNIDELWEQLEKTREEKKLLKRTIREYENVFEEQNGRKMLKSDRRAIDETYALYKEKKAKTRLLQALIKKQIR